jgi:hypothetical protein
MGRRRVYRWDRELIAAVCELVARFGTKRTAAMMGIGVSGISTRLRDLGVSLVTVKRNWTGKLGR